METMLKMVLILGLEHQRTEATLVEDIKEHKKAVTCFSLYEPGSCLLSGSVDKTIKVIKFVNLSQTLIVIREIEIGELII